MRYFEAAMHGLQLDLRQGLMQGAATGSGPQRFFTRVSISDDRAAADMHDQGAFGVFYEMSELRSLR